MQRNVSFILTSKCNLRCSYCFYKNTRESNEFLDSKRIIMFCNELFRLNGMIDTISLTGGEPLLHPDIMIIVKKLSKLCKKLIILTNGLLINSKIQELIQKYNIDVHISLDSIKSAYNSKYRNRENIILKNLENLKKLNNRVTICTTLSYENIDEIDNLDNFTTINGFSIEYHLINLHKDNTLSWDNASIENKRKLIELLSKWAKRNNRLIYLKVLDFLLKENTLKLPRCPFLNDTIIVNFNGDVYPCFKNTAKLYGNIYNNSIQTIMSNKTKYIKELTYPLLCCELDCTQFFV